MKVINYQYKKFKNESMTSYEYGQRKINEYTQKAMSDNCSPVMRKSLEDIIHSLKETISELKLKNLIDFSKEE